MKKLLSFVLVLVMLFGVTGVQKVYAETKTFDFGNKDFGITVAFPTYVGKTTVNLGDDLGNITTAEVHMIETPKTGDIFFTLKNVSNKGIDYISSYPVGYFLESESDIFWGWGQCDAFETDFSVGTSYGHILNSPFIDASKPFVYILKIYNVDKGENETCTFIVVPHDMLNNYIKTTEMKDETKSVSNNNGVQVIYKGKELNFTMPIINKNGRTFYPMRELLESLGASIDWNGTTNTATGNIGDKKVEFTIGSSTYKANGITKRMDTGVTPFIENGRTYIPIRYAAEGVGLTVDWNAETSTITIK